MLRRHPRLRRQIGKQSALIPKSSAHETPHRFVTKVNHLRSAKARVFQQTASGRNNQPSLGAMIQCRHRGAASAPRHNPTGARGNRGPDSEVDLTNVNAFHRRALSASRRRSNRLVKLWPRGALRSSPNCLWRTGRDTHLHLHAEMVRWDPNECAVERYRVARIAHDRNGDKANLTDAADRGVEIDPASARQIDLRPGMGRPAS